MQDIEQTLTQPEIVNVVDRLSLDPLQINVRSLSIYGIQISMKQQFIVQFSVIIVLRQDNLKLIEDQVACKLYV